MNHGLLCCYASTGIESIPLTTEVFFSGINLTQLLIKVTYENIDSNQLTTQEKPFDSNQLMNQLWVLPKSVAR